MKKFLSGNEAIARGALENGVRLAAAYPGTPSTEILENISIYDEIISEWAPNEKVALDVAVGGAYTGVRSMAVMKHVGLNVAADSFFYASMTGCEVGLLVVCADDPAMHSSQNEQDSRRYCKFARVPCLEPSDSQEAKDFVGIALEISELFDTPVMMRITTRIAHSHTLVNLNETLSPFLREGELNYRIDREKYVMVPGNARRRHPVIEERIDKLTQYAETFNQNQIEFRDRRLGIITNGISYQYVKEVFPKASVLKLGMSYPIPRRLIGEFANMVDRLIVIEELDPFIEEEIRLLGISVYGKEIFPRTGELSPNIIKNCAIKAGLVPREESDHQRPALNINNLKLPQRPPLLCPGCPHRGVFVVTNKLKLVVNGDIGCYTLGYLPPLSALHTCGCMGASIGIAHGANKVGTRQKNIAVLGDSTFFHAGMPALLDVAYNESDTVVIILDNRTTAMTGHQENPGTGKTLKGEKSPNIDFLELVKSLGVKYAYRVDPYDLDEMEFTIKKALKVNGPAVIVAERECALLPVARKGWIGLQVNPEKCNGCGLCFRVGCPAIVRSDKKDSTTSRFLAEIDPFLCTGCEICVQVCARGAILNRKEVEARREEVA
jgi:indolepyruvate ferredoxin oxidoreductase alpha subunit